MVCSAPAEERSPPLGDQAWWGGVVSRGGRPDIEAPHLIAVGQFYQDFTLVEDEEAIALLQQFAHTHHSWTFEERMQP